MSRYLPDDSERVRGLQPSGFLKRGTAAGFGLLRESRVKESRRQLILFCSRASRARWGRARHDSIYFVRMQCIPARPYCVEQSGGSWINVIHNEVSQ